MNITHDDLPTLVELNASPSDRAIFCLHPAGGGLRPYELLAQKLSGIAKVYGLEDPYIYDDEAFRSIPELAEYHVGVIRTVQPYGRYLLFGSCSGGPIAYETSCQLVMDGGEVDRVVMFGSHQLVGFDPAESERFSFLANYLSSRYGIETESLDWQGFDALSRSDVCIAIVKHLVSTGVVPTGMDSDWIIRSLDSLCRTREATKSYRPPRSRLDVDLYTQPRTQAQLQNSGKDWCDWGHLTTGTLRIVPHAPSLLATDDILGETNIDMTVAMLVKELSLN